MKYSFEVVNNILSEVYSFTPAQIFEHRNNINFYYLSCNNCIKWDFHVIKTFESKWVWENLDSNKAVFNALTLGILFPEKIELPMCKCFRKADFCEERYCIVNAERLNNNMSMEKTYPDLFLDILIMCESSFIDSNMVSKFYEYRDPEQLYTYRVPYK
ncbi:hypothetical protein [Gillisia sp. JM1]|uniref:hypothetical protein n=1 Tax=Gillisia sp. JM1 TaxID=1283286 RepID=UPI0003FC4AFA|nr:hypothetical protein [Gillisia sp. JM1]